MAPIGQYFEPAVARTDDSGRYTAAGIAPGTALASLVGLGAAAALRGRAERPDYRDTLAAVRCPVLIVVGADRPQHIDRPLAQAEVVVHAGRDRVCGPRADPLALPGPR